MLAATLNATTPLARDFQAQRKWYLMDATGVVLGRLASRAAHLLMGKNEVLYSPAMDLGGFVVVTNIEKVKLTGSKLEDKHAFYHTSHPGGGKVLPYKRLMAEKPEKLLHIAVNKMLPRKRISSRQILRLKIYRGAAHPHRAQRFEPVTF